MERRTAFAVATIACLAIATGIYAYRHQWATMNQALGEVQRQMLEMQRQAQVAQNPLKIDSVAARKVADTQLQIFQELVAAMKDIASATDKEVRTQERGWIGMEIKDAPKFTAGQPVKANVEISSIGRSPALHVKTEVVVEKLPVNQGPTLNFSNLYQGNVYSLGAIFQGSTQSDEVVWYVNGASVNPPLIGKLSAGDAEDIDKGKAYFVVYGRTSYGDTFGNGHATSFCRIYPSPNLLPPATKKPCLDYNDTDTNH